MFASTTRMLLAFSCLVSAVTSSSCVQTKSFRTSDGTNYVYDFVPAKGQNATVALIHGYPATRHDWANQVAALSAAGYGVVAPDCLGYGDSDLPLDIEAYRLKRLAGHFDELFEYEGLTQVVGVGHDWGTIVLSRAAVWLPKRFEKLVFLSVGYSAPGVFFDVDALNANSLKDFGYAQVGYWYFLNSYNAADLVASHLKSFFSLIFPIDNSKWGKDLADIGATRRWLNNNTTTTRPTWMSSTDEAKWMKAYGKKGAVAASMNYYKGLLRGISAKDEESLTIEQRKLKVPVLTIGGTQDMVTRAEQIRPLTMPWLANTYTERTVDCGHWMMYEKPDDVNSILLDFLHS